MPDPTPAPEDVPAPEPVAMEPEVTFEIGEPSPEPVAMDEDEPEPDPEPVAMDEPDKPSPVEVVVNLNTTSPAQPGDPKPDIEAEIKLIEAKRPFWDRLITSGLLPIALLVVGPACTWYFANKADKGLTEVKKSNSEVAALKSIVVTLGDTLTRADERLQEMEEEKAAELRALHTLSNRLDRTVQAALVQMAVLRLMDESRERRVGALLPERPLTIPQGTGGTPSRAEVIRRVTEQVNLPGMDAKTTAELAGDFYDRTKATEFLRSFQGTGEQGTPMPAWNPPRGGGRRPAIEPETPQGPRK